LQIVIGLKFIISLLCIFFSHLTAFARPRDYNLESESNLSKTKIIVMIMPSCAASVYLDRTARIKVSKGTNCKIVQL